MKLHSIRIGFLLLLLLSLSLLVACGGGGETASEGSEESSESAPLRATFPSPSTSPTKAALP